MPPPDTPISSSSDWDRVKYYAQRVRRFGFDPRSQWEVIDFSNNAEILSELIAAHHGSEILLPNLLALTIYARDILDVLDTFAGDQLRTIEICGLKLDPRPMPRSFCQLQPCASVERFSISNCTISAEEAAVLSKTVRQLTSLQYFCWTYSTPECPEDVLIHLSSLLNLKGFLVACPPRSQWPITRAHACRFPSLERFDVVVPDLDDFLQCFESVTSTQLLGVTAHVHMEPLAAQVQRTLAAIRDRLAAAPRAHVWLGEAQTFANAHEPDNSIPLPAHIDVDDALVKTMVDSWPRLMTLAPTAKVTLVGLIPLAMHCTELVSCSFLVDATTLPANFLEFPAGRYASSLSRFDFGQSPITNGYRVAAFLSDLFPQLRRISGDGVNGWADGSDRWGRINEWGRVNDSLQIFSEVRKQERLPRD
ncbi:hypothetical protein DFH06DRAFT_1415450 [Mycena polygramma]|nr:hypothetical protein DFH06DRAFT_1415450 [Mycena polygramma]